MSKRTPLVYMVSSMVLICKRYAAGCTKTGPKIFARPKGRKTQKCTRKSPKKAKPGAFWVLEGMGAGEDR